MRLSSPLAAVASLSLLLTACGADDDGNGGPSSSGSVSATDSTGTTVELDGPASRIACLTEPCVDALVELGMTPVAASPNGVASLPEFYGDEADDIDTLGGSFLEPAVEDVIAAEPDLVIGLEGVHEPVREALGDIPLYIVGIDTTDEALEFLTNAGILTGREDEAEVAAEEFETKLADAVANAPSDVSAAVVYTGSYGFNINGTGSSVVAEMLSQIVEYPFADEDAASQEGGYATFSVEQLLEADPDHVFVATIAEDSGQGGPSSEVMAGDAVWSRLSAVANDQVIDVRTPLWQYGRGTHSLGIILDEVTDAIA
jgi:iron complex transport system substrate-binding protein